MGADAIVARRTSELSAKFKALPSELGRWAAMSGLGAPFEKHHTQIRRVSAQVLGLYDEIARELEQLNPPDAVLTQARTLELRLLAVHSVWDYFRVKFVLRSQEPFASVLISADAFAWACYEPVQRARADTTTDRREPPLVAPQNQWSPTALPRGKAYDVARSPGGWTNTSAFARVIERLPIPILGLPWHALEHLPHLALLAHEVGHVVESDFGLQNAVDEALKSVVTDPNRQAAWSSWRSEVFADLFACYAAGSAFAWGLMDVAAADVRRITGETKTAADGWGDYPTTTLRILLNAECVRPMPNIRCSTSNPTCRWSSADCSTPTCCRTVSILSMSPRTRGRPICTSVKICRLTRRHSSRAPWSPPPLARTEKTRKETM
jgi:hypothetical protein